MARFLASQSLAGARPLGDTAPRYLARPALLLCTVAGLRNSDELFATSTDIASLLFLIFSKEGGKHSFQLVDRGKKRNNNNRSGATHLGLLGFDLGFEVLGDLALGLVMMVVVVAGLAAGLAASPRAGVRGPGPRQGACLGLSLQPLVGGAGGGREGRGPGPLGPGADLRGGRQLGQGRQWAS